MKNHFKPGKGWDGSDSNKMIVTYNDETMSLNAWALRLECSPSALRERIRKAGKGLMTWERAMMNKEDRAALASANRMRAGAKKGRDNKIKNGKKRKDLAEKKKVSIDSFLSMKLI